MPAEYPEPLSFGQRLKIQRTRRGMTREVLGGLVGRSASWVKALETGRLKEPRLPVLLQLAEALRVRDLADLTGHANQHVDLFTGPGHRYLPAVRAAIDSLIVTTDRQAPPVEHLRARLDHAWAARHASPYHREVLGELLPGLIGDAQLAAAQAEDGERKRAQALLSEVYSLSQFFLAYQRSASELLWRVAERGIIAAQDSGDLHAIGVASWLLAEAHRDSGQWDAADMVTTQALELVERHLDGADTQTAAMRGALLAEAAYTAARRGDTGTAWNRWDAAHAVAERLPDGYYHPVTSFSRAVMGAHAVTTAVELRAGREAVRQARAATGAIPSRPRRARHEIEVARAHHLAGDPVAALATLEAAFEAAPETIRYNGYARRIILEEVETRRGMVRQRAAALAARVGMD